MNYLMALARFFLRKNKILVLGDSHAEIFKIFQFDVGFKKYKISICSVPGATISGLSNPNSITQALPIFRKRYKDVKPDITIFQLGEVDVGFVIWYRHEKYGISVDELLVKTINNYQNLVLGSLGKMNTIIISAPLPTIKSEQSWGEVANLRKEIKTGQKERSLLTLKFNKLMSDWATTHDIFFLDLDPDSLASDGLVSEYLVHSDPYDHHYDPEAYAQLIKRHLLGVIN
jgi:hypothetical protein